MLVAIIGLAVPLLMPRYWVESDRVRESMEALTSKIHLVTYELQSLNTELKRIGAVQTQGIDKMQATSLELQALKMTMSQLEWRLRQYERDMSRTRKQEEDLGGYGSP